MENTRNLDKKISTGSLIDDITLAVSTQWHAFPERFDWIAANGFAMAYAPDPEKLHDTTNHVMPYLKKGVPVHYHGYFPGFELGDADKHQAEKALDLHMRTVDTIKGTGGEVMTVHIGLLSAIETRHAHIVQNLGRLAAYARDRGVKICLENLRTGVTSDPEKVVEIAAECGAFITLDVGHAVSCAQVARGEITVVQIIDMFRHAMEEVHFYEYETDTHHAPSDMSILGPVVDALLETDCRWWTIELIDYTDILNTRRLVNNYIIKGDRSLAA